MKKLIQNAFKGYLLPVLGFVIILFLAVYFISRPAFWTIWDLSNTGSIGDALNGITAPFIGTLGAVLVYMSFRQQLRANEIQFKALRDQRNMDLIFKSYDELKGDLEKIQPIYGARYSQPSMLDAFMQQIYLDQDNASAYPDFYEYLRYLNQQFFYLGVKLIGSNHKFGTEDSQMLLLKARHLYNLFFENYYDRIIGADWKSALAKNFKNDITLVHRQMRHVNENYDFLLKKDIEEVIEYYKNKPKNNDQSTK